MPTSENQERIKVNKQQLEQRFKQELLASNVKRMVLFCAIYAAFELVALLATNNSHQVLAALYGPGFWMGLNVVAICLGVLLGILCALVEVGLVRNPKTQNSIVQSALSILIAMQIILCAFELNTTFFLHNFLVFIMMLGFIPLLSHKRSVLSLVIFIVLSWASCLLAPVLFASSGLLPEGLGALPLAFEDGMQNNGLMLVVPLIIIASFVVSWGNYNQAKKTIDAKLALEQREIEIKDTVEERTAELREEARRAEASNQSKTRFLTRVSHELRTSMTTISGMAFLAKESTDAQSRQESLEAIEQASRKLKNVVDNILDNTIIDMSSSEDEFDQDFDLLIADAALPGPQEEPVAAPDLSGHKLLIVEDLATNRLVLKEFLKQTNATIEEAENGREALEMFSNSPEHYYSFIFMDLLMPEMNGHDATRAIRKMERSDALAIPIVAVSANAFKEDIEASLAAGMDGHIAKPIEQSIIFSTLIERLA